MDPASADDAALEELSDPASAMVSSQSASGGGDGQPDAKQWRESLATMAHDQYTAYREHSNDLTELNRARQRSLRILASSA